MRRSKEETFLWDDVHSAEMRRGGDPDQATVRADAVVARYRTGSRRARWSWLPKFRHQLFYWRWPLVALAVSSGVIGAIFATSRPSPEPYAGVGRSDAILQAEADAQSWWLQNLRLVSIRPTRRGAAPFWHLVYRNVDGSRVCVDVSKDVYYVGACG